MFALAWATSQCSGIAIDGRSYPAPCTAVRMIAPAGEPSAMEVLAPILIGLYLAYRIT
jgi:hypothetical protein